MKFPLQYLVVLIRVVNYLHLSLSLSLLSSLSFLFSKSETPIQQVHWAVPILFGIMDNKTRGFPLWLLAMS